ncbi:hypothetical protein H0H92_012431 [Tricholoma furcatifolium]|nr:hypothetical protein H0H92_012431 [Tricholoma furcatifolium]
MAYSLKLPFDIVCGIVDQISDHETLSACSLTFSGLRQIAQVRIFHQMTITVGSITPSSGYAVDISERTKFLIANPHIAGSIRSLTIRVLEDVNGASRAADWPASESLLTAFPRIQRISVADVSRSRYRGWWETGGEFAQALRRLLDQNSVRMLQVGAPGREREFEWPQIPDDYSFTSENIHPCQWDKAETKGLRILRAAAFRDRPDNLRTIQNIFFRSATSLTHVWLAFPSHSLPCTIVLPLEICQ